MKALRHSVSIAAALLLATTLAPGASCSADPAEHTQRTPNELGHEAAWTVAHIDPTDTTALQRAIMEARATHDSYVLTGDQQAASRFEQAFSDSLFRALPQLAQQIFSK